MFKEYSMLILAGGKSRRMGEDKAGLLFLGTPFWQVLVDKGQIAGIKKIYLSREGKETKNMEDVHLVYDEYPQRGPLGGMQAAFAKMDTPYCLVVSVDVPQIPVEVLRHLLNCHKEKVRNGMTAGALLLEHEDQAEPLIGVYHTKYASLIEDEIKEHSCPVFRVLDKIKYETDMQNVQKWQVVSLNTPQEYKKMLECMKNDCQGEGTDYE